MRILIVSAYFPPLNSIASLRPYTWAKYWSQAGHDVSVLTTEKAPSVSDLQLVLDDSVKCLEVPIPELALLKRFKAPEDTRRAVTQGAAEEHSNSVPAEKAHLWRSLKVSVTRPLDRFRKSRGIFLTARMPDHHDLWIKPAFRAVAQTHWDLVVSTYGPYACHLVAMRLKQRRRANYWIADFRDMWTQNHIFPGLWPFTHVEEWLERRVLRTADAVTTVSAGLARQIESKHGCKAHVIENGFDPDDYRELSPVRAFPQDEKFRILYTGTLYPGRQDPAPLFQAINELRREGFAQANRLRVIFAGSRLDNIDSLAKQNQVSDLVECNGLVPRDRALRMQRDADLLLFPEFDAGRREGILTGKLFEYLASGTDILGIGIEPHSEVGLIIRKYDSGDFFGADSSAIGAFLIGRLSNSNQEIKRDLNQRRAELAQEYGRDVLAARMLALCPVTTNELGSLASLNRKFGWRSRHMY
ncbi:MULTISPECIES: glycosyltransferase [Thiorhodovibrio]|uniref:glycosyltransferase n=1 Tax=Thiorhodovibrio TaxID=61593 RepID=UPI001912AB45|nr:MULTISPECIES: glycosyltransferase [Thiorhodovibrio]MBK5970505.1 hypothetical protein [Thiorhodovibrio winogradskyi]WPL12495.1 PEP-CTERM/exosortase A-associated glycosyltransferase, family [Thiorhodovibrio litoralis]